MPDQLQQDVFEAISAWDKYLNSVIIDTQGGDSMDMNRLRNLNIERLDADEMIGLLAMGNLFRATYESQGFGSPEWLDESLSILTREIRERRIEALVREEKLLETEERALMSREEKRGAIRARKEEIKGILGKPVAAQ